MIAYSERLQSETQRFFATAELLSHGVVLRRPWGKRRSTCYVPANVNINVLSRFANLHA